MNIKEIRQSIKAAEDNIHEYVVKELTYLQNLLKDEGVNITDVQIQTETQQQFMGNKYLLVCCVKIQKEF